MNLLQEKNMKDLTLIVWLTQLGLSRDDVSVEILAQAKPGFLGFGATPAKVQVTYEAPDLAPAEPEKPKGAFGSASRSTTKKTVAPAPAAEEAPKKAETPKAEAPKAEPKKEAPKAEPKKPVELKVYTPAEPGSTEEKIEIFIKNLFAGMHEAKPDAECISWTYGHRTWEDSDIIDYVKNAPDDAMLMQNFDDRGYENQLGVDESEVTETASFTNDLGADSLDNVELIMAFEKEFEIEIPDDDASEKIATVGDAIRYIEGKLNA